MKGNKQGGRGASKRKDKARSLRDYEKQGHEQHRGLFSGFQNTTPQSTNQYKSLIVTCWLILRNVMSTKKQKAIILDNKLPSHPRQQDKVSLKTSKQLPPNTTTTTTQRITSGARSMHPAATHADLSFRLGIFDLGGR